MLNLGYMQPPEGQPVSRLKTPPQSRHLNGKTLSLLLAVFLIFKLLEHLVIAGFAAHATDLTVDNILQAVNQQRTLRNLAALNTDSRLTNAAEWKANDMIVRKYFAHVDPDGNYIWPKIVAAGYSPYLQLGENLAIEFYDTDSLVAAWMNSPTHRENILQPNFKDQGMGLSFGDASQGQYHTAIANTFGALLVSKTTTAPAAPAAPSQPKAAPKAQPSPTPAPVSPSLPETEPSTTAPSASHAVATTSPNLEIEPRQNALLPSSTPSPSVVLPATASPAGPIAPLELPVGQDNLQPYQITHDFTLAFGMVLLLFLIIDAQKLARTKMASLDKKMSNLALLLISLVVIAFMYWL